MVRQHRQPFAHWNIILERQMNMKSEVSLWLILDKLNQKSFGDGPDRSSKSSLDLCRITDWNIVLLSAGAIDYVLHWTSLHLM